jgi:hypothetical protein
MYSYSNGVSPIFSVQHDETKIVMGDSAGTIKLLDFSGEMPRNWGTTTLPSTLEKVKQAAYLSAITQDKNYTLGVYNDEGKLDYSVSYKEFIYNC